MRPVRNRAFTVQELKNLGNVLPLHLKDDTGAIEMHWYNERGAQRLKPTYATLHEVEWLTGESINCQCTQWFLPLKRSDLKPEYTVEEFRYLVSRAVCVPATLLAIVFQPVDQGAVVERLDDHPVSIKAYVAVVVTNEFQTLSSNVVHQWG